MLKERARAGSIVGRFRRDERGTALVLVTVMLPILVGFSLLAIDMARVNNLHNDLQKAADAFALAAAAELDGQADAHDRADRALANLVANDSRFSDLGLHTLAFSSVDGESDIERHFLTGLPLNDDDPIDYDTYESDDPAETRLIEVRVNPTPFTSIFPASFLGGANAFNVAATAVAGFGSAVCDFTPVFICNPYEDSEEGLTLADAVSETRYRRRQISLRSVGGGSAYFPGNFGFLDAAGANGARALAEMIASSRPLACYSSKGVDTKTGQNSGPVKGAINIRFGIKEPGANWTGADYGPAPNVRKGVAPANGNACPNGNQMVYSTDPATGLMGLPTDNCHKTGNCPLMGGRMGDGNWDINTYWSVNHPGVALPQALSGTGDDLPTRYEVYRYEIDHNLVADTSTGGETGTPKSGCGTPVTSVDRRLLYGAILNCQALEAQGYDLGGHEVGLPPEAFASFFITEPVKDIPQSEYDANIFVELVDITGRHGNGTLENFQRDEAQLYR
ncbi:TadE/TadG family type IV pilus assembly protein [Devosia sp.]|uniref:TadE/TadG family type IV pilus assembly protein n=1 Tax=Devosia sp. TaxID=1871048 RepID=UPI002F0F5343